MSIRNNEDRVGAPVQDEAPVEQMMEQNESFSFATPTEFVELPTKGRLYPENHPLHNVETLEIRYMTAKDEDTLTSQALLKKGIAIDRFLQNIIVDKRININDLYVGDKNALIIASRITGYGEEYAAKVPCTSCGVVEEQLFDLSKVEINCGDSLEDLNVEKTDKNTFIFNLPKSKVSVEVRLLTGAEEKNLIQMSEKRKKLKLPEAALTDQIKTMLKSVNGNNNSEYIESFVENMPAIDSRYLRGMYTRVTPNVDLTQEVTCSSCNNYMEVQLPFTVDFFWPK